MAWLPDGEKKLKIWLSVLTECTNVTDRHTDIHSDGHRMTAKAALRGKNFAVNRFLMKLFRSNNTEIIAACRRYFQFNLPSELIEN